MWSSYVNPRSTFLYDSGTLSSAQRLPQQWHTRQGDSVQGEFHYPARPWIWNPLCAVLRLMERAHKQYKTVLKKCECSVHASPWEVARLRFGECVSKAALWQLPEPRTVICVWGCPDKNTQPTQRLMRNVAFCLSPLHCEMVSNCCEKIIDAGSPIKHQFDHMCVLRTVVRDKHDVEKCL